MTPTPVVYAGSVSKTGETPIPPYDESEKDAGLLPAMLSYAAPPCAPPSVEYDEFCVPAP